jgi:hypothetical protein
MLLALLPWIICYQILEHFFFSDSFSYERIDPIEYLILETINSWFFFTIDISALAIAYKMLKPQASRGETTSSPRSDITS